MPMVDTLRQEEYWMQRRKEELRRREEEKKQVERKPTYTYMIPAEAYVPKGVEAKTPEQFEKEYGVKPELPKGALITKVEETKEGYQIEYVTPTKVTFPAKPTPKKVTPLTLKEREYELAPLVAPTLISIKKAKLPRLSETLAPGTFERGFIASGETLAETFFPYPTPTPKHHTLEYLVFEAPLPEKAGYVTGEVLQAIVMAKVFEGPITLATEMVQKIVAKIVPKIVKRAVKYGKIGKTLHKLEVEYVGVKAKVFRKTGLSRLDVWLKKHWKWYYTKTGGIARGEVVIPPVPERIGLAELKAQQLAWELTIAPRTGGVWVGKTAVTPVKSKAMKHLIFRAGKLSVGYLRELEFERPFSEVRLTPQVSQQMLTRMGIQPYTPKMAIFTAKKAATKLPTLMFVPKIPSLPIAKPKRRYKTVLQPKVWQPTFAYEKEKLRTLTLPTPKRKEKERLLPTLKLPTTLAVKPQPKQLIIPKQKQIVTPKLPTPTVPKLTWPKTVFPYFPRRGGAGWPVPSKGLFGRWFKRKHPIPTPEQVARRFGFKLAKKRKRKKKPKRRRKG